MDLFQQSRDGNYRAGLWRFVHRKQLRLVTNEQSSRENSKLIDGQVISGLCR